jgi:acyl carrier protein phosphodiesterase
MKQLFSHMTNFDLLYNYRHQEGLSKSIRGMCKRFPVIGNGDMALSIIDEHYDELKAIYTSYFPILDQHIHEVPI